jgi:hypothetical protein
MTKHRSLIIAIIGILVLTIAWAGIFSSPIAKVKMGNTAGDVMMTKSCNYFINTCKSFGTGPLETKVGCFTIGYSWYQNCVCQYFNTASGRWEVLGAANCAN